MMISRVRIHVLVEGFASLVASLIADIPGHPVVASKLVRQCVDQTSDAFAHGPASQLQSQPTRQLSMCMAASVLADDVFSLPTGLLAKEIL